MTPNGVVGVFGGVGLGPGEFSYPRAITAEPSGAVYVVDKAGRVQRFAADGASRWGYPSNSAVGSSWRTHITIEC
jgi:hypothetical protein